MSDNSSTTITDRYSSRYNRGFLKLLEGANEQDLEKFLNQYYNSPHYLERLESIKFLAGVRNSDKIPADLFLKALQDPCSQVIVYLLKSYNYDEYDKTQLIPYLRKLFEDGDSIQVKTLALEKLAQFKCDKCLDLFFNASLMKSNKIAAAGLRGLHMLDNEKAYSIAKFKSETAASPLDIEIAHIFSEKGNVNDSLYFTTRFTQKNPFQQIEFAELFVTFLLKLDDLAIVKKHLQFISDSISDHGNQDLIQSLILLFHQAISNLNKSKKASIVEFLNSMIDALLEQKHIHQL